MTVETAPNWRQIPRNAFDLAYQWLRENILSKSSKTFDLSQLRLHISKIDGSKFTDLTTVTVEAVSAT